jgi:uncharacterized protein YuzE
MRIFYDPDSDTLEIIFKEKGYEKSLDLQGKVVVDLDKNGDVVALEILRASKILGRERSVTFDIESLSKTLWA